MPRLISFALVVTVGLAASGTAFAHAYVRTAVPPKNATVPEGSYRFAVAP